MDFQNLVAAIERSISSHEGVTIESPKRLRDKDTGRLREHDIVITWRHAHHVTLTAIECRDKGRKVGVPEVEAFSKKCEKTGIHHRVIVSASGFANSARAKASALDIVCMELREAEAFDWMGIDFFVRFDRTMAPIDVDLFFEESLPAEPFVMIDEAGEEITKERLASVVNKVFSARDTHPDEDVGKVVPIEVPVPRDLWKVRDGNGDIREIASGVLKTTYTTTRSVSPARAHAYTGPEGTYAVVTTDAALGAHLGKLIFVRDDNGIKVTWHPED